MFLPYLPSEKIISAAVPVPPPFFKKDSPTADVRAIFPQPCATIHCVCNFVPNWDEVNSMRNPCRHIASSFILQEKARSDGRISVIHPFSAGRGVLSRRHDSYDRYDGYFGIPLSLSSLTGEHPVNANAGVGFPCLSSARKPIPAVRKIPRFFRLRLQGVTHYTLLCKEPCARRSLWTPLWQGFALLYPPLSASDKRLSALPVSAMSA